MYTCTMIGLRVHSALNKAGRQAEALHLLEQLAENAITETQSLNKYIYLQYVLVTCACTCNCFLMSCSYCDLAEQNMPVDVYTYMYIVHVHVHVHAVYIVCTTVPIVSRPSTCMHVHLCTGF